VSGDSDQRDQAAIPTCITAGLLIAVAPIVANLFAFLHEVGYCRVFGIPTSFISLTPTTVFVVAGALVIVFCVVFWMADTAIGILHDVPHGPIRRGLLVLFPFLLLFAAYLYLYRELWEEWIWVAAIVAGVAFYEFVFPLAFRWKGSYREKLDADWQVRRRTRPLTDWFGTRLGRVGVLLIVTLVLGLMIAYAAGRAEALQQEEFLVLRSDTEAVVLRHYGSNFILAPFDRETKDVQRSFFIVRGDDDPRPVFTLEDVGPLRSKR
jgi:hypothetical protein